MEPVGQGLKKASARVLHRGRELESGGEAGLGPGGHGPGAAVGVREGALGLCGPCRGRARLLVAGSHWLPEVARAALPPKAAAAAKCSKQTERLRSGSAAAVKCAEKKTEDLCE